MNKKTIKYFCIGFDNLGGCQWVYSRYLKPLVQYFEFIIDKNNPDYIFCGALDTNFDFIKYDCVRIFISEENVQPMFHLFDYWIGYDQSLNYSNRFLYAPPCIYNIGTINEKLEIDRALPLTEQPRPFFCDFIYSHDDNGRRMKYFNLFNKYKAVHSFGTFNHTQNDPYAEGWPYNTKIELQKKCKFSLIIESSVNSGGLVTEKIFHALLAGTVPIYIGDSSVKTIVNKNRFININDFESDEELLRYVIEIDSNEKLYNKILAEEPLVDKDFFKKQINNTNRFLFNIFSKNLEDAKKRPNDEGLAVNWSNVYNLYNKRIKKFSAIKSFLRRKRNKKNG